VSTILSYSETVILQCGEPNRELLCIGENGLLYDKNLDIIKYRLNHLVRLSLSMIPKLKYETLERFQRDSPESLTLDHSEYHSFL
jgi:hypothetical protein